MESKKITNSILKKIMKEYVFIFESLRDKNKYYIVCFSDTFFYKFYY